MNSNLGKTQFEDKSYLITNLKSKLNDFISQFGPQGSFYDKVLFYTVF